MPKTIESDILDAIFDFFKMQIQPNLMDGFNVFLGPKNICLDTKTFILGQTQVEL